MTLDGIESTLGILAVLVPQLPVYAVWIIGIIIAATRLRQHRRRSQVAIVIFCLLLIDSIIGSITNVMIPQIAYSNDLNVSEIGTILGVLGIIRGLFYAALWSVVLWLIFGWRRTTPAPGNA